MSTSTSQTEASGHRRSGRSLISGPSSDSVSSHHATSGRRSKRSSSYSLASRRPTWVLLNERGVPGDDDDSNDSDRVMSLTSTGEQIFVSFDLVEPPRISFLTVNPPQQTSPKVVAAHRDVVLFEVDSASTSSRDDPTDYFVYKASCGSSGRLSVSLLPVKYCEGRRTASVRFPIQLILTKGRTGILSTSSKEEGSFVVADLLLEYCPDQEHHNRGRREFNLRVLWSGSDSWMTFRNLHVCGANDGHEFDWWCSDAVVPYGSRSLIWVDYYRGMIFADLTDPERKPDLRYVQLPVDRPEGNPYNIEEYSGRGHPELSRSLSVTRYGIKFVSIDHQRSTNFGVEHWKWTHTFRITIWSLSDDGVTWRRDARLYAEDLWALDSKNRFPHVAPEFPVVNIENPNAVCFTVDEERHIPRSKERVCMVEIDIKREVLLAVTDYSKERRLFNLDSVKIATDLPRYMYAQEPCKKRRQEHFN